MHMSLFPNSNDQLFPNKDADYTSCLKKNTCLAHPVEIHRVCSSPDIVMSKPISPEPAGPSSDCLIHVPSPPPFTRYSLQPDLHFDSSPSILPKVAAQKP